MKPILKCVECGNALTSQQIASGAIVCSKECYTILLNRGDRDVD